MAIVSVPVATNETTRQSRLFKGIPNFIKHSLITMVRMYAMYKPLRTFFYIGTALSAVGAIPILRFFYFYLVGQGDGHIQSLILGGALLVIGLMTLLIGLLADLINFNRQLLEMTLERVRRLELERLADTETSSKKAVADQMAELDRLADNWGEEPVPDKQGKSKRAPRRATSK